MSDVSSAWPSLGLHSTPGGQLRREMTTAYCQLQWSSLATEGDGGPSWSVSPNVVHMKECGWSPQPSSGPALAALAPESRQPLPLDPRKRWSLWAASCRRRHPGHLGAVSHVYSSASSCTPDMLGEKTNGTKVTLAKSRTEGLCTSAHTRGDPCVGAREGKEKRNLQNEHVWQSRWL